MEKGLLCFIYIAASEGHLEIVRTLYEHGVDVNRGNEEGETPLYAAAANGRYDIAEFLIEKGASIDKAASKDDATPLYMASQNGHIRIVKLLLDAGADPEIKWKIFSKMIQKAMKES